MPFMPKYRAVALDLDGTLLNASHEISHKNLQFLKKLHAMGVKIIIASGRMTQTIYQVCAPLTVPHCIISYNGGRLIENNREPGGVAASYSMDGALVERLYGLLHKARVFFNIYRDDVLLGFHPQGNWEGAAFYRQHTGAKYEACYSGLEALPRSQVVKILTVVRPEEREELFLQLKSQLNGTCQLIKSEPEYLEFTSKGVTKGATLKEWSARSGILLQNIAAMGDAENDLEMLQAVGWGKAVANARPGLKTAFPNVSPWSNDEDAVMRELAPLFNLSGEDE